MNEPEIQAAPDSPEPPSAPPDAGVAASPHSEALASTSRLSTLRWFQESLRTAFFLIPRVAGMAPTPWQVLITSLVFLGLDAALSRLGIAGAATFNTQVWLSGWWTQSVFVLLIWWALQGGATAPVPSIHVAAAFVLWLWSSVPAMLVYELFLGALTQGWISPGLLVSWPWWYWVFYVVFVIWSLGAACVLVVRVAGWNRKTATVMALLAASVGLSLWQFNYRAWEQDYDKESTAVERPRLHLSQQVFEDQQALWQRTVEALAPQREGVTDVYGLVFAPYAPEDVFLRESQLVSDVLASRFDAAGRVIHLLNNPATSGTLPWATTLNLQRAIDAIAQRMDREHDVLVVYMTSHGASDFKLSASHWPLELKPLTPGQLREALDKAGIRNRVIAISACFSGGWVEPLAGDNTLVMTAADATHTSYGCGSKSELTFFGRAMFDEQLRKTHSFEKAFAQAVPLIKQREIDAGKQDGFSNPQIRMGTGIAPVLKSLEQRLDALPQPTAPAVPAPAPPASKTRP